MEQPTKKYNAFARGKGFIPDLWGGLYKFLSELASARSAQRLIFLKNRQEKHFNYIFIIFYLTHYILMILF